MGTEQVIYEVTAIPRTDLCDSYEVYMRDKHIPDVLATGYFVEAFFEKSVSGHYRTRYVAGSRELLDGYLQNATQAMREDFIAHFPEGMELIRDEWIVLKHLA
jgi:hypothetical protein